jgi:hypothetical protein
MTHHELAEVLAEALDLVDHLVEKGWAETAETQARIVKLQAGLITATDEACRKLLH